MPHVQQPHVELSRPKERHAVIRECIPGHVVSSNTALLHCRTPVFDTLAFPSADVWKVRNVSCCINVFSGAHTFINNHAAISMQTHAVKKIRRRLNTDSNND